jgi:hypothetical protein
MAFPVFHTRIGSFVRIDAQASWPYPFSIYPNRYFQLCQQEIFMEIHVGQFGGSYPNVSGNICLVTSTSNSIKPFLYDQLIRLYGHLLGQFEYRI